MKNFITILILFVAVGCATTLTPEEQKALRDSVVGEYEFKHDTDTFKQVYLENGICESYVIGREGSEKESPPISAPLDWQNRWSIVNGEIHVRRWFYLSHYMVVYKLNADKSITCIAEIKFGARKDMAKNSQTTYKRIK